ncbi:response regulator transcription factor [Streptomyces sp. NPDC050625]|jgi:DNA-binding NarL/FixJ family response regulator|uniref:response regulator transcription factor n=1 Tax=Streptomyces sp. NPDC050625 TaxID=3154629 RepID=UPI00341376FB
MDERHATLHVLPPLGEPAPLPQSPELPEPAPAPAVAAARPVRVHIVGADPLARTGIRALLEGHPGITVTGESAPGPQLGLTLHSLRPHVLVVHGPLSVEQRARLAQDAPDGLPVLVVGGEDEDRGPVHGHLPGTTTSRQLAAAVVLAAAGYTLVPAEGGRSRPRARVSSISPEELTQRECEVLELLARGLSNGEIARSLTLSEHTVKTHVQNMLHKLGLPNRVHAAIYAFETGVRRPV